MYWGSGVLLCSHGKTEGKRKERMEERKKEKKGWQAVGTSRSRKVAIGKRKSCQTKKAILMWATKSWMLQGCQRLKIHRFILIIADLYVQEYRGAMQEKVTHNHTQA
jgi:hypothetical protein